MFRMVALDLDGTVLDNEGRLPPVTEELLGRLRQRGVAVVVATGRMSPSALPWAVRLGGAGGPFITYNGAKAIVGGEVLLHHPLPLTTAQRILDWATRGRIHMQAYCGDRLLAERGDEKSVAYGREFGVEVHPVVDLAAALDEPPTKLLSIGCPEELDRRQAGIEGILRGEGAVFRSATRFLDIMASGVNKGTALRWLAEKLGVVRGEVAAFGDGENDQEMLAWAELGVAMEHAPNTVREAARLVVPHADGRGVAGVLKRILSGDEFEAVAGDGPGGGPGREFQHVV